MDTFLDGLLNDPRALLYTASHVTTLCLLAWLTYRLGANLRFLHKTRQGAATTGAPQPRVSVLVPARNEAATITPCVSSLLRQAYDDYEVIVLNDGSTDSTGALLDALVAPNQAVPTEQSATAARLRVIHAHDALPAGWNGKSYACHRLAHHATGEWLLFTDADTVHTPQSIAQGIAQAQALGVDFLCALPHQVTKSWSERILVSFILDFLPLVGLDLRAISQGRGHGSAGNGQYLLMRATTYHALGGHAAIAQATLDDFALARRVRQAGHRIALVAGGDMLACRMYRDAHAVWEGFSRSLMHGLDTSTIARHTWLWALAFAWCYACLFVNPFLLIGRSGHSALALFEIVWMLALRAVTNWSLQRPVHEVFTTPLAAWGVMALGLTTLWRRWRGRKVAWKGRYYMG